MKKIDDTIAVIVPAYNEEDNIGDVIDGIRKLNYTVFVVDDGSQDDTATVACNKGAIVIPCSINNGKAHALRHGANIAVREGYKKLVFIDADGQHEPNDIPKFINALKKVDIVFGCRVPDKNMPLIKRVGNYGLSLLTNIVSGIRISDSQNGFKALTAEAYKKIHWNDCSRYAVESDIIISTGRQGLKFSTVKIDTIYIDANKGTTMIDGIHIGLHLLKRLFKIH